METFISALILIIVVGVIVVLGYIDLQKTKKRTNEVFNTKALLKGNVAFISPNNGKLAIAEYEISPINKTVKEVNFIKGESTDNLLFTIDLLHTYLFSGDRRTGIFYHTDKVCFRFFVFEKGTYNELRNNYIDMEMEHIKDLENTINCMNKSINEFANYKEIN